MNLWGKQHRQDLYCLGQGYEVLSQDSDNNLQQLKILRWVEQVVQLQLQEWQKGTFFCAFCEPLTTDTQEGGQRKVRPETSAGMATASEARDRWLSAGSRHVRQEHSSVCHWRRSSMSRSVDHSSLLSSATSTDGPSTGPAAGVSALVVFRWLPRQRAPQREPTAITQ